MPNFGFQPQQLGMPMGMPFNPYAPRGQQDLSLLTQLSQGFSPVMTAQAPQMRTGFENLPGFNQPGLIGLGMNAIVAPMLTDMMGKMGMSPGGLGSQNMVDFLDAQSFQREQSELLQKVSPQDERSFFRTVQGIQALTGAPMGPQQRAAARRLASTAASVGGAITPYAPELVDVLAGRTGSASVMAMRMQQFNRYRMDPVTGQMGYTPESNAAMAEGVFEKMFEPGNMANMRGLRAGQVGSMYGELTRRGMVGATDRRESAVQSVAEILRDPTSPDFAAVKDIVDTAGHGTDAGGLRQLDTDEMDKLRGLGGVQAGMRDFDATAVKGSLSKYVDAVTSMREIFGDAGVTNAPMSELIKGLEALSQGSMTQIDPKSLNMMVRTTQQLAKQSGMSIDAAIMMQQQGAQTLQGMGVNRAFAPSVTQGAMAFGQATGTAGVFSNPVWGLENADWHRQMDQNLRASATASVSTNAIGALMNAREVGFDKDKHAQALSDAVEAGQTHYTYAGKTRSVNADLSLVENMLVRQGENELGMDTAQAQSRAATRLNSRQENQRGAFAVGGNELVRQFQPDEFEDFISGQLAGIMGSEERADAYAAAFTSMDPTNMSRAGRNKQLFTALRDNDAFDVADLSDDELRDMINTSYGQLDTAIAGSRYRSIGGAANAQVQYNRQVISEAGFNQRKGRIEGQIRDSLTGLTGHGLLGGAIDALQKAGDSPDTNATLSEFLGATFGGVRGSEIADKLTPAVELMEAERENIAETRRALANADPSQRPALLTQLDEQQQRLRDRADEVRNLAEEHGLLDRDDALDMEDINAFREARANNQQNRMTAAGLTLGTRGINVGTEAEQVGRAQGAGGLLEDIGLTGEEGALMTSLTEGRFERDDDGVFIDDAAAQAFSTQLVNGTADLSQAEKMQILNARKDALSVTPTKGDVTAAMVEAGIMGDQQTPERRAQFLRSLSTRNRMQKTGVTEAMIGGANTQAQRDSLSALGISPDSPAGKAILLSDREQVFMNKAQENTLGGSIDNWNKINRAYREGMTPQERAIMKAGSRAEFEAAEGIIDQASGADFIGRAGGAGLLLRDELQELQTEEARLIGLFGGDRGAALAGAIGDKAKGAEDFSKYALANADAIFEDGKVKEGFAPELVGRRKDSLKQAEEAQLGAQYAQQRIRQISERRGEVVTGMGNIVSKGGEVFGKDKKANIKNIARLKGLGLDDATLDRIASGVTRSEDEEELAALAESATQFENMTPQDRAALPEDDPLRESMNVLTGLRTQAGVEAEAARLTGGGGALVSLGTAAGIRGNELSAFTQQGRQYVGTSTGATWASALGKSVKAGIEDYDDVQLTAIQEALKTGDMAELQGMLGREKTGDAMNMGRVLQEGGLLEKLASGKELDAADLTGALETLQDSQKTVGEVTRQTMDVTGTLNIAGDVATLIGTGGVNRNGLS
jgi:hypothetical protein